MVIPTYWNFPGIILNDETYLFGQVSLFFYLPTQFLWKVKICEMEAPFAPRVMLPLAVADSVDALAVGVSFAFLKVNILPAVLMIGLTTFVFSMAGVKIGNHFGAKYKSKAEVVGGIVLLLMGCLILVEHLWI